MIKSAIPNPGLRLVTSFLLAIVIGIPPACQGQDDNEELQQRRNWDPVKFVKRLDRDNDGQLTSEEMGGRSGRFIAELGFDVSRPVATDRVIRKIEADQNEEAALARRRGYEETRSIPGFGDEIVDLPEIPGFGPASDEDTSGSSSVSGKFDEETENTVTAIMERYDENKDGFLAGEENRRVGRWVGSLEEADTDKDGRLSPVELAEGFKVQIQRRRSSEGFQHATNDSGNENADRGRGRGNDRESTGPPIYETPATGTSRTAATAPTARSMDGRMTAYVDGVFQKYDKNGDNQLDGDEISTVKVQFKDTDGDGFISREEATSFVAGAQNSTGSVSPAYVAGQRATRNRRGSDDPNDENANSVPGDVIMSGKTAYDSAGRSGQEAGNRRDGASDKFAKLDENNDGQLQMNEFAKGKKWSDEIFNDFVDADSNRDGVITADEFDQ